MRMHVYRNRTSYASMRPSGTQAADFIKVLGQLKPVDDILGLITSHSYTSGPSGPMNTRHRVWPT
jgi:hypothetical protein